MTAGMQEGKNVEQPPAGDHEGRPYYRLWMGLGSRFIRSIVGATTRVARCEVLVERQSYIYRIRQQSLLEEDCQ